MGTPFSLYDIFVIEERFGFNKTTPKIFIMDKLKGWLLGAIIGGGLLALIVWFYQCDRFFVLVICLDTGHRIFSLYGHVLFLIHCSSVQ